MNELWEGMYISIYTEISLQHLNELRGGIYISIYTEICLQQFIAYAKIKISKLIAGCDFKALLFLAIMKKNKIWE